MEGTLFSQSYVDLHAFRKRIVIIFQLRPPGLWLDKKEQHLDFHCVPAYRMDFLNTRATPLTWLEKLTFNKSFHCYHNKTNRTQRIKTDECVNWFLKWRTTTCQSGNDSHQFNKTDLLTFKIIILPKELVIQVEEENWSITGRGNYPQWALQMGHMKRMTLQRQIRGNSISTSSKTPWG